MTGSYTFFSSDSFIHSFLGTDIVDSAVAYLQTLLTRRQSTEPESGPDSFLS